MKSLFIVLILCPFMAMAQMSAEDLLTEVDKFRLPYTYTQLSIKIVEYKKGKMKNNRNYTVYQQNTQSLIDVLDGSNKGNRILLSDKGMFVAPKRSSRAVRITPIQRLLGQTSYGDLASLRFKENYTASIFKQKDNTIVLELIAKKISATYRRIILFISKNDYRPLHAQAYLASGKLYKKMSYTVKDKLLKNIVYTTNNKHTKTVMYFLSVKKKKIAKRFLTSKGMRNKIR